MKKLDFYSNDLFHVVDWLRNDLDLKTAVRACIDKLREKSADFGLQFKVHCWRSRLME